MRPELPGGLLPVFVLDRYEGLEPRLLQDFTPGRARGAYVDANVAALRELLPADLVFTNHVLMGGAVGRRHGERFRVKAHGSELEYSMRGRPELEAVGPRVARAGRRGLRRLGAHPRRARGGHRPRRPGRRGPPGVDVDEFVPQARDEALAELLAEARADPPNPGNAEERLPDEGNAARLEEFLAGDGPPVVYFGKLILTRASSCCSRRSTALDARAVIVGFGDYRAELERSRPAAERVLFTGPLEHRHLAHLLPLADAAVVPSIFPEAFGMVAAEAAACGCPPLVARHSGLAEVAAGLEAGLPGAPPPPRVVPDRRCRRAAREARGAARACRRRPGRVVGPLARPAVERWSWAGVAARFLAPVA